MAVWSKALVCSSSIAGIASSNPAGGIAIRLLYLLCVVWVAASWSLVQGSPVGSVCLVVCCLRVEASKRAGLCSIRD
jgi:hypothetical protein